MIYGYARCSTDGQELAAQTLALKQAGCDRIYNEKVSGVRDRPQLAKLLKALQPDDVVIITHLDRLSRSTQDLLNKTTEIAQAGAKFRSLSEPWADTTTPMGNLITTIMSGFAQFNREMILARCNEGRKVAKAQGKSLGRRFKLNDHQQRDVLRRYQQGESFNAIAKSLGVSHPTIAKAVVRMGGSPT